MRDLFHDCRPSMSRAAATGRRLGATVRGPVLWLTALRRAAGRGDLRRHHHDGRRIPRARAGQQRARTGEHRAAARPGTSISNSTIPTTLAADVISQLHVSGVASRRERSGSGCRALTRMRSCGAKVGVLSYLGDIAIYNADGRSDQLVAAAAGTRAINISDARATSRRSNPIRDRAGHLAEAVRSLIDGKLNTVIAHRLSGEERHLPRRDDAAHRPRQLREILCVRGARPGCRDLHVPSRRQDAGALSACRRADRQEFRYAPLISKMLAEGGRHALRVNSPVDHRTGWARGPH